MLRYTHRDKILFFSREMRGVEMKIVIVGDGKVGLALTARLSRAGHDVVVIDRERVYRPMT